MRKQLMAALCSTVLLVGGCSTADGDPPAASGGKTGEAEVATLRTGAPTLTASATPPQAERPRERLDDTPEDKKERLKPYMKCLTEHGVDITKRRSDGTGAEGTSAASKACEHLMPLPPWEFDPANPEAKDFARDVVQCLKGKGVRYVEVGADGTGWAFGGKNNDSESISKGLKYSPACEREVAAKRK
ncbi:hypothetical protein [Micromonospora sp. HUAS LYJ1]|uniref:hypothetical protein n=1 Tax=Micromonospora sp. HUAS LYJ1 TaxID=3061626 RepID=UPI00267206B9|nr:hypothetical protein [Micromonospora sp. HUAS LYJ1]WKU06983.1 hypothetical protein Q2K16_08000 [Micromonospora sp. HUAS LYJ1]